MPSESDKWGWEHVSVFGGFDRGSGTKRWKCNHCNLRYNGSYSRVRAHLLGSSGVGVKSCPAIDKSLREAFQILEEERLQQRKKRISGSVKPGKRIRPSQPNLTWKTITREDVDEIVSRFFYADGLNIDIVNSPYFRDMVKAIGVFGSGYEAPSTDKMSNSFLSKEKAKIVKSVALVREFWPHTGCTVLCISHLDGALGCFHISIFVSSPRGLIFLKAVDVDDSDEGNHAFTGALIDAIMEVGPSNVLQIISHLGNAGKSTESRILSKFPNIFWSPCTSHSILALMEEIAKLEWVKPVILCAKAIEQCMITYQHASPSLLIQNLNESFDQISANFAPSYCSLRRILELRSVLQEMVVGEEWNQWKHGIAEDVVSVESSILGDDFWSKAHLVLQLYDPFVKLLAKFDIEKALIGAVYDWRVQALESLRSKAINGSILNQLEGLIESRWDILFSPLHATGYILNPRYTGKGQAKDKSVMRGWKATVERYESESDARRTLREQLSSYWHLEGSLGDEDAVECRDKMDPVAWWENFGFDAPNLQALAIKVLSQVSSVTTCQEIWRTNNFPSPDAVKGLGVASVEDLFFVRNNLRIQSQRNGHLNSSLIQRHVVLNSISGAQSNNSVEYP